MAEETIIEEPKESSAAERIKKQPRKVKNSIDLYDFEHPGRMTKDQIRGLRTIHENFSRSLGTYFTTLLRTIVEVKFVDVHPMPFLEFLEGQSDPDCVWIFKLENLDGKGIMEVSPELVMLIVERLFGGEGGSEESNRAITSIEERVAEKIVRKCLDYYNQAWERVEPLNPILESFEHDPRLAQIASAGESCMIAIWDMTVRDATYSIKMCLPVFAIDPIMRKLSAQSWLAITPKKKTPLHRQQIQSVIESTGLDLRVYLGDTTVSMHELINFKIGDVIVLEQKIKHKLRVHVGDKRLFMARAGVIGANKAIRIVDWCKQEG